MTLQIYDFTNEAQHILWVANWKHFKLSFNPMHHHKNNKNRNVTTA